MMKQWTCGKWPSTVVHFYRPFHSGGSTMFSLWHVSETSFSPEKVLCLSVCLSSPGICSAVDEVILLGSHQMTDVNMLPSKQVPPCFIEVAVHCQEGNASSSGMQQEGCGQPWSPRDRSLTVNASFSPPKSIDSVTSKLNVIRLLTWIINCV